MAGVVLETLSWKKLITLGIFLLVLQIVFFLIGAVIAPAPTHVISMTATRCYDRNSYREKDRWFTPRGKGACESLLSLDPSDKKIQEEGITAEQVVFSFWIPWPRDGHQLKMHRYFQFLLAVLQLDIEYDPQIPLANKAKLQMDIRLAAGNKEDNGNWTLLASSMEDRNIECDLTKKMDKGDIYDCDLLQLFELGSVHYHYYLVNIRLPTFPLKGVNIDIGKIVDMHMHGIHQNGGFSFVWFSLKTAMFPMILGILIWFWRRITQMCRPPNLLERTLFSLGIVMTILNCPIEWFTLAFDIPFMLLLNDIRQGVFYAMLLSFWIIFTGEHVMDQTERNRLSLYWKHLAAVVFGCICMFVFEMCERGIQLKNPFFSVWTTPTGTNLALAFIILAGVAACCYFLFLCYMVVCVFKTISAKRMTLPSMSSLRRRFYMGLIYRFKFLMLVTLFCSAMTVIFFIISQLSEGQWKWGDEDLNIQYTSGFFTGVYGMWNVYIFGLLSMYAPSHKTVVEVDADENSQEESVQLTQLPSSSLPAETSALQAFVSKSAQE
ncbi:protein wntless homolog [Ylistrum balloti]|uniref:protein wntless homolog n=1 Tax=Ylistrum balloti TaxID=509963 RepID=UPI002905C7B6|nr:protein wntless homolog [Ylistrum balloti]